MVTKNRGRGGGERREDFGEPARNGGWREG